MAIHKPSWFSEGSIAVSTAPTMGLTKGGRLLSLIDEHGERVLVPDPDTGVMVNAVNDVFLSDAEALVNGQRTETLRSIPIESVSLRHAVPVYYDRRFEERFAAAMQTEQFSDFTASTIGALIQSTVLSSAAGHGSPSGDQRVGEVPYIKVSDLRAGLVNINPTNRIPNRLAEKLWGGPESGLNAFDILTPARTSKNIGDFCMLMPGQEQVVLTKEIIVLRPGPKANFDASYLLWAMTLKIVRDQWRRVVFMQTNREDVGKRWHEIQIPVPNSRNVADECSKSFRAYYLAIAEARESFASYLRLSGDHHFFVSGAEFSEETVATIAQRGE